jgi:RNA polymerase sigma-70 factor (ECF subfamily)
LSEQRTRDDAFEAHRKHLMAIAYRMTGSVADSEDILQDAYLRWCRTDRDAVRQPKAFLSKTVTRLCIDSLESAKSRREQYVGPWLPEPVLGEGAMAASDATELAQDISMALMMALERLSPAERAAFLLHDVFDADYAELAETLQRSEAACRQLVSRARAHVKAARPRYEPSGDEHTRVVRAFGEAISRGDVDGLREVLSDDAVLYPDGGGRIVSALRPIRGADRVARFVFGVLTKFPLSAEAKVLEVAVNGAPGFYIEDQGRPVQTIAFDVQNGRIAAMYIVRNPEKLARLRPVTSERV